MIRFFGTKTSPYVRRVRLVAHELDLSHELVDISVPGGTEVLRSVTPIWKIPVAEIDGTVVLDSHVISEQLLARYGAGRLRPLAIDDVPQRNLLSVIDGAQDALISIFLAKRDNLDPQTPFLVKQRDRAASALAWVDDRVGPVTEVVGLPDIALASLLTWAQFRELYPVDQHPRLTAWLAQIEARPSFTATRPQ